MTWTPEDDEPIEWLSVVETDLDDDGHVHIHRIDPRWVEAGLRDAKDWLTDAAAALSADWVDTYLADPSTRAQMDALTLDDHGHWHCPLGGHHDWDDTCECDEKGTPGEH